jgi:hypothetical protein
MDSQLAELPDMQVVTYSEDSGERLERQREMFQSQESEGIQPGYDVVVESEDVAREAGESKEPGAETSKGVPTDLLTLMWEAMQADKREREEKERADKRERIESEKRAEGVRRREREEDIARIEGLREDIIKNVGAITEEFKTEVNNKITQVQNNLDVVQNTLSESVTSLREETRQQVETISERMNVLNERVTERMYNQIAEIRDSQKESRVEIEARTKEFVSNELSKFKTKVTKENFVTVQKEVEAINRDHQRKFAEMDNRLERLQERVAASSSRHVESASADRVSNEVIELGRQTLSDPSSILANSDRDESVREKHVCETRVSPSTSATQVEPQVIVTSDKSHMEQNDIAGLSQLQFNGNVISDLALPKFNDARRQNVIDFWQSCGIISN